MLAKKHLLAFALILTFQIVLLLIFVFFRLIDFDEGIYLSAAQLVRGGELPYLDFFYNQMPYLPYVYSIATESGFASLFLGRLISAAASLLLGVLLFWFAHKMSGDAKLSLFVFFLYSFHGLILTWHSTVKTSTFSDLWSFVSFIFFASYVISQKPKIKNLMLFLAGIFVGLALNFRLTHLAILICQGVLIFFLFRSESIKRRMCNLLLLFFGAILSSCFAIYLFFKDPQTFLFDNLVFRQVWGLEMIRMSFVSRLFTLSKFLLYPQDLLILILAALSLAYLLRQLRKNHSLTSEGKVMITSTSLAFSIIVVSFLISPTQFQYFQQALPFLLIACLPALKQLTPKWQGRKMVIRVIGALYLLFILPFLLIFVFGIRGKDQQFQLKQVREVVEVVQENSEAPDRILASWPGYVVLSGREPLPGLKTGGWEAARLFSPRELEDAKLIARDEIEKIIADKKARLIVDGSSFLSEFGDILDINYQRIKTIGKVKIYKVK